MISAFARKGLILAAASGFLGLTFAGSGQTTTLDCAGGGASVFGSNNTLTLTGGCAWLDMVSSNNRIIIACAAAVGKLTSP